MSFVIEVTESAPHWHRELHILTQVFSFKYGILKNSKKLRKEKTFEGLFVIVGCLKSKRFEDDVTTVPSLWFLTLDCGTRELTCQLLLQFATFRPRFCIFFKLLQEEEIMISFTDQIIVIEYYCITLHISACIEYPTALQHCIHYSFIVPNEWLLNVFR